MAFDTEVRVAVAAVREAAALCRSVQADLVPGVLQKDDRSPVTVADFGSQAIVCRALAEAFPDDPVMAEEDTAALRAPGNDALLGDVVRRVEGVHEGADRASVCEWIDRGSLAEATDRFWVLDPIDGTKGFLRGDQYAIALALVQDGALTVAALACPNLPSASPDEAHPGVVFAAAMGRGASVQPLSPPPRGLMTAPVHVSTVADPIALRLCESVEPGHTQRDRAAAVMASLGASRAPVRLDSQAKYGVVARGEADAYLRLPTRRDYVERAWDHAAGALIVTEAGGIVTDVDGRPLDFSLGPGLAGNRGVVATNGLVHDRVLAALAE